MIEQFFRPEQLGQALELKARFGNDAVYMGGGSKLNAAPTRTDKKVAISLDKLGLGQIEQQHGQLHIGATVTLQALKDDPRTPAALCEALGFVYSRHLRNQATLGGELACQQQDSPLLPVLPVLREQPRVARWVRRRPARWGPLPAANRGPSAGWAWPDHPAPAPRARRRPEGRGTGWRPPGP